MTVAKTGLRTALSEMIIAVPDGDGLTLTRFLRPFDDHGFAGTQSFQNFDLSGTPAPGAHFAALNDSLTADNIHVLLASLRNDRLFRYHQRLHVFFQQRYRQEHPRPQTRLVVRYQRTNDEGPADRIDPGID